MKIISKYKDYYDYLQGIYGVDEKLVLDRRDFQTPYVPTSPKYKLSVYVGNVVVDVLMVDGKPYVGESIVPFAHSGFMQRDDRYSVRVDGGRYNIVSLRKTPEDLGEKSLTWEHNCAILTSMYGSIYRFPILRDLGIPSALPPEQVWQILSAWLGQVVTKSEPIVPVGDDKVRIQSAGFDLKTSFRK